MPSLSSSFASVACEPFRLSLRLDLSKRSFVFTTRCDAYSSAPFIFVMSISILVSSAY